jgi:uncharacterized protein (TIGR00369 family)
LANDLLPNGESPSQFQQLLGFRIVDWREGYAELELTVDDKHRNRHGLVHGGVLSTLIDTACGFSATWCPIAGRVRHAVTLSLTTMFTGQARQGTIRAVGRKRGGGRRVVFCSAEVLDSEGQLLAMGEGTFRYQSGSEVPEGVPL